jgi:hypothetical protein
MSRRFWLLLSLMLNVLLAGIVAKEWHSRPATGISPLVWRAITQRTLQTPAAPRVPDPAVMEITEPFNWQSVEATDCRVFIENLRAIGCPDLTIFDIVSAEVDEIFNARVKELVDGVTGNFWNLVISSKDMQEMVEQKEKELEALRDQKGEMLSALFGETNPADEFRAAQSENYRLDLEKSRLDFLPEEKQASVLEIKNRFAAAQAALENSGTNLTALERSRKSGELQASRDRELQAALTPSEYDEYHLRISAAADVRDRLPAFDGTEEEFRAIALAKMNSKSDEPIRQLLGPERFAAYQRAQDDDYLQTLRVTDRFKLPEESAVQIHQMQRDALARAKIIRNDNSRADEERQAILQAIQAETERSIGSVLGPTAFAVYRENAGNWIEQIAK